MSNTWSVTDVELQEAADAWAGRRNDATTWHVHLFKNDYSPVPGDNISAYEEADFPGYVEQPLTMSSWTPAAPAGDVVEVDSEATVDFTADTSGFSSQTVYGYYLTDGADAYRWGERFTTPRVILPYDVLSVNPRMNVQNAPS